MKNWLPLVFGPALAIESDADLMLRGLFFTSSREFISRPAAAGAGGVAALDHEIGDHAMKFGSIIKFLAGEEDKIIHRDRRVLGKKIAGDLAFGGLDGGGCISCSDRSPSSAAADIAWTLGWFSFRDKNSLLARLSNGTGAMGTHPASRAVQRGFVAIARVP